MNFELNKIAGAILLTLLVYVGIRNLGDVFYHIEPAGTHTFVVEGLPVDEESKTVDKKMEQPDMMVLLATASVSRGQKIAKKCNSCHGFEKGESHKIGPALWGVVNRPIADPTNGFRYSKALQAIGGVWDDKALSAFIENPRTYAKGTRMAFIGIRKPQDRAHLIAYMRSLGDETGSK